MPGKLPHDHLDHQIYHLTYLLAGSLTTRHLHRLQTERDCLIKKLNRTVRDTPPKFQSEVEWAGRREIGAAYDACMEAALHSVRQGPFHLQRPDIAKIVLDSWQHLHQVDEVFVYAICIMGNHVHVVLSGGVGSEGIPFGNIVKRHKNFTALKANRILGRTGQSFWARTYFDRRIRRGKFMRVMWYVLNNPVKPGLVTDWK